MTTNLYGGALSSIVPAQFADASLFRQIPDNQEVFVDDATDDSMVFDILEKQDGDIKQASRVHLEEISSLNNVSGYKELHFEPVSIEALP